MSSLRAKLSDPFDKLRVSLVLFVFASFVFMSSFGMGMGMEEQDGQMSACPFMASEASICQMGVTEHIAQWQRAFLGVPTKMNLLALVIVLLAGVIIPFVKSFSQFVKLTGFAARLFAYHKAQLGKVFAPLLLAFAEGILNPKIF